MPLSCDSDFRFATPADLAEDLRVVYRVILRVVIIFQIALSISELLPRSSYNGAVSALDVELISSLVLCFYELSNLQDDRSAALEPIIVG